MGCGASVDGDSDSQASLEEWERNQPPRRRSISPDLSDADSETNLPFRNNQNKDMRNAGFQVLEKVITLKSSVFETVLIGVLYLLYISAGAELS